MAYRLVGQGIAKRHVTDAEEVGLLEEARRVVHHVVRVRRTVGHGPRPIGRWAFGRPSRLKFVAEDGVSVRRTALSAASGVGPFPRGVDLGAEGVLEVQPEVEAFIGKVVDEGARDLGEGRSGRHTVVVVDDAVAVLVVILHVARPDAALPERLAAGLSQDLLLALVDTLGTDQVERRHRLTHLQDVARPYFDEVIRAVSLLRERHDLVMLITEREAHIPRQATATQRMSGDHGLETLVTDPPHVGRCPRVTAQGVDGVREQQVARILVIPVERQLQASIEERGVDT